MISKQRVIVFLPAYNEEKSIADVIKNVPRDFHPNVEVLVLVINDGSTDHTVDKALKAGADYIHNMEKNNGLGAAVRTGLKESLRLGADIAVMIDADNEYPAKEIPNILEPIFEGKADYVMGSRFLGKINGMRLHRRMGNYCFTFLQSILLGRWIYDGQSGMRAFSHQAMEHAEIIHDYNYAQVITLNLLRKGFRMMEIPINYHVRTTGKSFIKFRSYLLSVIPAIIKEMRSPIKKVNIDEDAHRIDYLNRTIKYS